MTHKDLQRYEQIVNLTTKPVRIFSYFAKERSKNKKIVSAQILWGKNWPVQKIVLLLQQDSIFVKTLHLNDIF
jgi:hypothetical protein